MKHLVLLFSLLFFCSLPAQRKMKNYDNIIKSTNIYELDAFLRDAHPDDPRRSVIKPKLMNLLKDYVKNAHPEDPRVKDMQEKLALLRKRPSTKISFDEMNAINKQKQIKFYQEQLERAEKIAANPELAKKPVEAEMPSISDDQSIAEPSSNVPSPEPTKNVTEPTRSTTVSATTSTAALPTTSLAVSKKGNFVNPEQAEFDMLLNPSAEDHKNQTVKILNALFDNDPTSKETTVMIRNTSDCDIIMRMESTGNMKYRLAIRAKGENTIVIPKGQYLFSSLVCGAQYSSQKTVQKAIMVTLGNPK